MKKILLGLLALPFAFGMSWAVSSADAFRWAYDQWIIDINSHLQGNSSLQRQEFAPLLLKFLQKVVKKDFTLRECKAKDLNKVELAYLKDMEHLCAAGLLQGENGSLFPLRKLTRGQALALVMRSIDGVQDESTKWGRHWAQGYFDRANALGYQLGSLALVKNAFMTYEELIGFLYMTQHPQSSVDLMNSSLSALWEVNFQSSDDALRKLAEIMAS